MPSAAAASAAAASAASSTTTGRSARAASAGSPGLAAASRTAVGCGIVTLRPPIGRVVGSVFARLVATRVNLGGAPCGCARATRWCTTTACGRGRRSSAAGRRSRSPAAGGCSGGRPQADNRRIPASACVVSLINQRNVVTHRCMKQQYQRYRTHPASTPLPERSQPRKEPLSQPMQTQRVCARHSLSSRLAPLKVRKEGGLDLNRVAKAAQYASEATCCAYRNDTNRDFCRCLELGLNHAHE